MPNTAIKQSASGSAEVVVVDSIRTGLGKAFRGSLNQTRSEDMLAHLIDNLLLRNPSVEVADIEDLAIGMAVQVGEQGSNLARLSVIRSSLSDATAAYTVNRFCASGLQAIANVANQIATGSTDVAMAGGVESVSMRARQQAEVFEKNPRLLEQRPDIFLAMGETAEIVASRYRISRAAQDDYAVQSQTRYQSAVSMGKISAEIVPMNVRVRRDNPKTGNEEYVDTVFSSDECNRPDTTADALASLKSAFVDDGSVTAGNASQLSDGASLTLLMSVSEATRRGLQPLGYFRGFVAAGCAPDEMGIGPVFAIPKLLRKFGLTIADIDLWELNEAFASQCLYCRDELGIDNEKFNVNGGSIAIGHPFGATGSRMSGAILRELRRTGGRYGVVSMCIGGGQGAAALFEVAEPVC